MARTRSARMAVAATHCGCFIRRENTTVFLPPVSISAHATLFSSTSRTVLKQTFVNPQKDTSLDEVDYAFPLYDGVSVVGFTCEIAGRSIRGVVKEREQAEQEFTQAKEENKFAGLLQRSETSGDIFMTSLGNVPAGSSVSVEITYLGELKHDAEVDGLRYTIPTTIAPRYGESESFKEAANVEASGISITVDAKMPSTIKSVQSSTHTVSVNVGTTSVKPDAEPSFNRASASLTQRSTQLQNDFVLHVVVANLGEPSAVMETHSKLPTQRALMTTLVPKFGLPPLKPEIVFLCDRSGSMGGKMQEVIDALRILLKSIPAGAKFNICSFGSDYKFLWDQSASYTEKSYHEALRHVNDFSANFGGTEIYDAMKQTFAQRFKDVELEVIMLTDGQISSQDRLFGLIQDEVSASNGAVRVFTLGVGSGVSTSLIEGAARAGNGASQTVANGEKMDLKVMRMLKASLSPHIKDYSLEVKYEMDDTDDFEIVEKVFADVSIDTDSSMGGTADEASDKQKITTSLFDPSYKEDTSTPEPPAAGKKYDHLPAVPAPSYLQAPCKVPPLFAFNRTTVYVLMSGASSERRAKSVVLRGTSSHGPLELEIPIQSLKEPGTTIHQLAARKAVEDLEKNGGWLSHVTTSPEGQLLKDSKASQFSEIVEREAVRLGVKYQVSGKWCSFVAVDEEQGDEVRTKQPELRKCEIVDENSRYRQRDADPYAGLPFVGYTFKRFDNSQPLPPPPPAPSSAGGLFGASFGGPSQLFKASRTAGPSRQRMAPRQQLASNAARKSAPSASDFIVRSTGAFGSSQLSATSIPEPFKTASHQNVDQSLLASYQNEMSCAAAAPLPSEDELDDLDDAVSQGTTTLSLQQIMHRIVALQSFDGSWTWTSELEKILGCEKKEIAKLNWPGVGADGVQDNVSATVCAIAFLKKKLRAEKETWEMIADKGEQYVQGTTGQSIESLERLVEEVPGLK